METPMIYRQLKYATMLSSALLVLFSESIFAQSSPPLLSNDPCTPGPGNWEINIFTAFERSDVYDEWQIPQFDINYGVGDRTQLTVSIPFVISHETGSEVRRAFDGMEMGVKYRFLDNPGTTGPNFSLFPRVYFSFEDEKDVELSLPLQWHQEWSHFGLTAEFGHIWVNGKSEGWEGGVGAALFLEPVDLLVEWHTGVREAPFDLRDPMVNVGFTWEWSETVSSFASFGKSLQHHEEETNTWSLAGFQFRF
jgi:hypothetical protein